IIGVADLMEEIALVYCYDRIPETRLSDALPPQRSNVKLEREERVRDVLIGLGLQEVITYRMSAPDREARLLPPGTPADERPYVRLANPIASDKVAMRHSLVNSVLEVVERNARVRDRLALFEIGPVFFPSAEKLLPDEIDYLVIVMTGPQNEEGWQGADPAALDFYDLKGVLEGLFDGLHLDAVRFAPCDDAPSFHPGKCARMTVNGEHLGVMGELHPLVHANYEVPEAALLVAEIHLDTLLAGIRERYNIRAVPAYPPAVEDLAVIVEEERPAEQVAEVIQKAGGELLAGLRLFDVYRGAQLGEGKKSLAYRLTYQSPDHTLDEKELGQVRQQVIRALERELGAQLRS
ncbi:MAG TPA: hypothetical protein VLS48_01810, partial [Anaerolineales bacterium]|nr:hypothetical protein [Anaerolineales bacterium]